MNRMADQRDNADDADKPAENVEVVNAEAIKSNLRSALTILEKYGVQAPSGAAGLAYENVNGMTARDLQAVVDKIASAERAAGGAAVQQQSAEVLSNFLPFIGKKNETGLG